MAGLRVGTAHDEGQLSQGRIVRPVTVEKRIERAPVAVMPQIGARDVEGDRILAFCHGHDFLSGHEQKNRLFVDETRDQPRAGDAVHTRLLTRDPLHRSLLSSVPRMSFGALSHLDAILPRVLSLEGDPGPDREASLVLPRQVEVWLGARKDCTKSRWRTE